MEKSEDNMNLGQLFDLIQKLLGEHPILKEMLKNMSDKMHEEQSKMGKVDGWQDGCGEEHPPECRFWENSCNHWYGSPCHR